MNIAELVPAEIAEHVRDRVVRNMTKRVGSVYEIDIIAKNGRRVPLEVSTTVITSEGRPVEIQGIAVPSVIRGEARVVETLRAVDKNFFFGI
jgi:sporulation protein YlmC with PRC-barrel domain